VSRLPLLNPGARQALPEPSSGQAEWRAVPAVRN